MISTMPKDGAAPTSPNAMPGGLGAILQQPGAAPKGASPRSIAAIMDRARTMSDMQLADVLSGKSLDVPQYVAMTEAMGRKSLRTAMQGQQAQQQLNKPSVKDRLLAEEAQATQMAQAPQGGIDQLPAPNMGSVDMASGGIVAFQNNENQPVRVGMPGTDLTEEEKKALAQNEYMQRVQAVTNPGAAIANFFANRPSSEEIWNRGSKARTGELKTFTNEQTPKGKLVDAGLVDRNTPIQDVEKVAQANLNKKTALNAVDREEARAGMVALANAQQNQAAPKDTDKRSNDRRANLAGNAGVGINPDVRANPFGQLKTDLPDYEKVKNQGLGEAMLAFSGALFGNRNLAEAMAQGLPTLAKISGNTRKEVGELKKDYNAQQLSLAKASELFEQGQEDKAFKYLKQSQDHAFHMTSAMAQMAAAGKPSGEVQLLQALAQPGEKPSDTYARMKQIGQDPKQDQALKLKYADYQKSAMGMVKPLTYDQWLASNGLGGATMANNTGSFSAVYGPDNKQIR